MSTNDDKQQYLISSNVDVAPNEYVLKYSYNRNFLKLCKNDEYLASQLSAEPGKFHVETYNKKKTYRKDEYVFYKLKKDAQQFYLLQSLQNANMHKPLATIDDNGNIAIVNGEWWKIVGIPYDAESKSKSPKGIADEYVLQKKNIFRSQHEQSDDLHPTRELGFSKSTVLFKNLTNIDSQQSSFMYPSHIEMLHNDDTIQHGYLRKWENGLLEYDIVFKVGVVGKTEYGQDLISANNQRFFNRNTNNLYFKEPEDFAIFAQGGTDSVVTDDSKQVNLNRNLNAYVGNIQFPEPFKDTNYMIFTTNIKNVDIESPNVTLKDIEVFDNRLCITGLEIDGYKPEAQFKYPLEIPSAVVNIKEYALAEIQKTENYPVDIRFQGKSNINVINEQAFAYSKIDKIEFPSSLKYIASKAFYGCDELTSLTFNLKMNPKDQVKIDFGAFANTLVSSVTLVYEPTLLAASKTEGETRKEAYSNEKDLYEKLKDSDTRIYYGLNNLDPSNIKAVGKTFAQEKPKMMFAANVIASDVQQEKLEEKNYTTINIQDFLKELEPQKNSSSKILMKSALMKGANDININTLINALVEVEGKRIVGFNNDQVPDDQSIEVDLGKLTATVDTIATSAFAEAYSISSLIIPSNITSIESDFIGELYCDVNVDASNQTRFDTDAFRYATINVLSIGGNYAAVADFIRFPNNNVDTCYIEARAYEQGCIKGDLRTLVLKSPTLSANCISVNVKCLSVDMTHSKFENKSFSGSLIDSFVLKNIKDSQIRESNGKQLSGLYADCFLSAEIDQVEFQDIDYYSEVSVMFQSGNVPDNKDNTTRLEDGTIINTIEDCVIVENNAINAIPSYLILSEDKTNLISCDFARILYYRYKTLIMPISISSINSKSMQPPMNWPPETSADLKQYVQNDPWLSGHNMKDEDIESWFIKEEVSAFGIETIIVPESVQRIEDYAFASNEQLKNISFNQGINLSYIGDKIISGCNNLEKFEILT